MTNQPTSIMKKALSSQAQAVLDAAEEALSDFENYGPNYTAAGIAAALCAVAESWKVEILNQANTEFISGINNCITSLTEIALDLKEQ